MTPAVRVVLVRHGRTAWNLAQRFQGQTDIPLDEQGRAEADAIARRLADLPIVAIFSSDLQRAAETAERIAAVHGLPVRRDPALREIHYGDFEGLTAIEIMDRLPVEGTAWWGDRVAGRPPGGESIPELRQRLAAWWDATLPAFAGSTVVVVGHGGSLQPLIGHALRLDPQRVFRLPFSNTGMSEVTWSPGGRASLEYHNLRCHVDA